MFDEKKNFLDSNQAGLDLLGYSREELLNMSIPDVDANPIVVLPAHEQLLSGDRIINYEHKLKRKDGKIITVLNNSRPLINGDEQVVGMQSTLINITDRKKTEEALQKLHNDLERRIEERTSELAKTNLDLQAKIIEHKKAEEALLESEKELETKTINLEEVNAALKVLLKRREEDKKELEETVLSNMKELVAPYMEKFKTSGLNDRQISLLSVIESNLNDIVIPFSRHMSMKYSNLTPKEIQVAGLVKDGKTTKEIAEMLNSSTSAINFHRNNLRQKLGLKNKKTNLRSHLLSFMQY